VWAFSQGSYAGPLAASISKASFLILVAEYAINLREDVVITNVERLRRQGLPNEEIERYKDYTRLWHQAIMEKDFKAAERAYLQYEGASWLPRNRPVEQAWTTDWSWERARLTWPYEPAPILRTITMPVLAFWGSEDQAALPSVNRPALERALRDGGNSDYTLRVITGAGHDLFIVAPLVGSIGYTPEYIPGMLEWLQTRVANKFKN
jgi:pimeloyl-ACP methyl ester carboxylesterase